MFSVAYGADLLGTESNNVNIIKITLVSADGGAKAGYLHVEEGNNTITYFRLHRRFVGVLLALIEAREKQHDLPQEIRGWTTADKVVAWIQEHNDYVVEQDTAQHYARNINRLWRAMLMQHELAPFDLIESRRGHGVRVTVDILTRH
jgi:hypothetical protein